MFDRPHTRAHPPSPLAGVNPGGQDREELSSPWAADKSYGCGAGTLSTIFEESWPIA